MKMSLLLLTLISVFVGTSAFANEERCGVAATKRSFRSDQFVQFEYDLIGRTDIKLNPGARYCVFGDFNEEAGTIRVVSVRFE